MWIYMGDWMMDYVAGRLASAPGTAKVGRGGGDKIGGGGEKGQGGDKIGGEKGCGYTWGTG